MAKLAWLTALILFNTTPSYSQSYTIGKDVGSKEQPIKFSSMFSAKMHARFKNEHEGYGDYKDYETVETEEMYIIDGIKVIVTDNYVKQKEAQLDRKAKRSANDPHRMKYMEECISLTQNLDVCKELWEERQR